MRLHITHVLKIISRPMAFSHHARIKSKALPRFRVDPVIPAQAGIQRANEVERLHRRLSCNEHTVQWVK